MILLSKLIFWLRSQMNFDFILRDTLSSKVVSSYNKKEK